LPPLCLLGLTPGFPSSFFPPPLGPCGFILLLQTRQRVRCGFSTAGTTVALAFGSLQYDPVFLHCGFPRGNLPSVAPGGVLMIFVGFFFSGTFPALVNCSGRWVGDSPCKCTPVSSTKRRQVPLLVLNLHWLCCNANVVVVRDLPQKIYRVLVPEKAGPYQRATPHALFFLRPTHLGCTAYFHNAPPRPPSARWNSRSGGSDVWN